MHIENLKKIIYQDSKYNFIFTEFDYAFSSNHLFGEKSINEDIYNGFLFLGPHHLCEVAIGIKPEKKTWDVELMNKSRANLPLPSSFAANHNMFPNDYDIEQDFVRLLKDSNKVIFLKEPTLPEVLAQLEGFFSSLLQKDNIPYIANSFSDKILEQISTLYDLNNSEINSVIFDDKQKGIFHKKLSSKLAQKSDISKSVNKI